LAISGSEAGVKQKIDWLLEKYAEYSPNDTEEVLRARMMCGTPDQIIEKIKALESEGMGYLITYFGDAAYDPDSMNLFASEVMPAFE
jgi:alkanesulfonate monooxygenase SsuD/methylene tetrahydromethanopterin reductase-like flavin-dependent oxidoreductase (luciferase family)